MTAGQTPGALDDYRWLTSHAAAGLLDELRDCRESPLALDKRLRKSLPAPRVRLVLEQLDLRRRAAAKFTHAERIFFERVALEQATDQWIAQYKAQRLPTGPLADLCCGIGGDAMALAARGRVTAVDLDPLKCLLTESNLRVLQHSERSEVVTADVAASDAASIDVAAFAAWHIDPDRRADGRRTTSLAFAQPSEAVLEQLLERNRKAAIKLAPATQLAPRWSDEAEAEWISRDGECRQLVCWFGQLAIRPGCRAATIVARDGAWAHTITGTADTELPVAPLGTYLYEPDAAVLASRLVGHVAAEHQLTAVAAGSAYLSGDHWVADRALAAFAIEEVLPLDRKRLRGMLRQRRIGSLEIKKRGLDIDPERLRRELALEGDKSATLLLTNIAGQATAILARRVEPATP